MAGFCPQDVRPAGGDALCERADRQGGLQHFCEALFHIRWESIWWRGKGFAEAGRSWSGELPALRGRTRLLSQGQLLGR